MFPAIVIPAYNRPRALTRLLSSLQAADYPSNITIPLIISIDPENGVTNQDVNEVAESFQWTRGPKEVVRHEEHLGLLNNFHYCGQLTERYGSIVFLEDDILVSPVFYHYTSQALDQYKDETKIAGISLYRYAFNGYTHYPFEPLSDDSDVFFMQLPSILGQCWTNAQWEAYCQWRETNPTVRNEAVHDVWSTFPKDDYFPILVNYLVATSRFYVFPRLSLTTGFGDAGTHFTKQSSYFQVPLQHGKKFFDLSQLQYSNAVYDSFMEMMPDRLKRVSPSLSEYDFCVDLNATKNIQQLTAEYVVSTRACNTPLKTYALAMHPPEANLVFDMKGEGINLCRVSNLRWDKWSDIKISKRLHGYHSRGHHSLKRSILYSLLDRFLPNR